MKLQFLPDGSRDCPLIRLYDFDQEEVLRLKESFDHLADGSATSVLLHEQAGVEPIDRCQLILRTGKRDAGVVQSGASTFECTLSPERWSDVAALAESICAAVRQNTYQWLNEDGEISLLLSRDGRW